MLVDSLLKHVFYYFFTFLTEVDEQSCFSAKKQKQMILTSKWRAEHPFAGKNTQQVAIWVLVF